MNNNVAGSKSAIVQNEQGAQPQAKPPFKERLSEVQNLAKQKKQIAEEAKRKAESRNEKMKVDAAKPPTSPDKKGGAAQQKPGESNGDVDEMGTIHLIDSLDPDSKKVLNSLVQSVLVTQ